MIRYGCRTLKYCELLKNNNRSRDKYGNGYVGLEKSQRLEGDKILGAV